MILLTITLIYLFMVWLESRRIEAELTYLISKLVVLGGVTGCLVVYDWRLAIVFFLGMLVVESIRQSVEQEVYKFVRAIGWMVLGLFTWKYTGDYNYPIYLGLFHIIFYNPTLNLFRYNKLKICGICHIGFWEVLRYSGDTRIWYNQLYYQMTHSFLGVVFYGVLSLCISVPIRNIFM